MGYPNAYLSKEADPNPDKKYGWLSNPASSHEILLKYNSF